MITSELKKLPFFTPAKSNNHTAKFWKPTSQTPTDEGVQCAHSFITFMQENSYLVGANILKSVIRDIIDSGDFNSEKSRAFFSELELALAMSQQVVDDDTAELSVSPKTRRKYGITLPEAANEIDVSTGKLIAYMVNNEWVCPETMQPTDEALSRKLLRRHRERPFAITHKGLELLRSKRILFG